MLVVDRIGLAQMIASRGHHACDLSSRRHLLQLLLGSAIGGTAAGRPFALDTQGAPEAVGLHAAPKFGSIAAGRIPQFIQQRRIGLNRALPNPEDIGSFATDYLANELTTMAGERAG